MRRYAMKLNRIDWLCLALLVAACVIGSIVEGAR